MKQLRNIEIVSESPDTRYAGRFESTLDSDERQFFLPSGQRHDGLLEILNLRLLLYNLCIHSCSLTHCVELNTVLLRFLVDKMQTYITHILNIFFSFILPYLFFYYLEELQSFSVKKQNKSSYILWIA